MILTCPSCETQYFADDSTIGESGRTVKCATCGHSWFVRPEGIAGDEHAAAPAAHEIYRERVREQRRRKSRFAAMVSWIVTAALFFTLGLAAIIFRNDVVKFWPESATAYKRIGFSVNRFGLEFENIERSRTFNDTIPVVTVTGKAVNVARSTVDTPAVRVSLMDERGEEVALKFGSITPAALDAGETGTFRIVLEQAPMESFEIELSFVDKADVPLAPESEPAAETDTIGPDMADPDTESPAE
ncbi:MJ0042-type zinc finger domain-containing protein [Hyphomonas sp.]|uniref:MJ0042-type zinc finger domain-containing protein n=1 Tax=Hyphomonas sp. TaxID=87 RepID=UPI0032EDD0D9